MLSLRIQNASWWTWISPVKCWLVHDWPRTGKGATLEFNKNGRSAKKRSKIKNTASKVQWVTMGGFLFSFSLFLTLSFNFGLSSSLFSTSSQQTNHISKSSPLTGCITCFWHYLWQIISLQVDRQSVTACRLPPHYPRSRLKQALASFHCVREDRHSGKSEKKRQGRLVLYVHNCCCNPSKNGMLRRLYRDALSPLPLFLFSVFMETILTIWQSELQLLCDSVAPKGLSAAPSSKTGFKRNIKVKMNKKKRAFRSGNKEVCKHI